MIIVVNLWYKIFRKDIFADYPSADRSLFADHPLWNFTCYFQWRKIYNFSFICSYNDLWKWWNYCYIKYPQEVINTWYQLEYKFSVFLHLGRIQSDWHWIVRNSFYIFHEFRNIHITQTNEMIKIHKYTPHLHTIGNIKYKISYS